MSNRREKYDLIFSMGSGCGCATILHQLGLQLLSLPFDWVGHASLRARVDLVGRSFDGWMLEKNMEKMPDDPAFGQDRYVDRATDLRYWHDFPLGSLLAEELPRVREKYDRRVARLNDLISRSKRILMVWMDDYRDDASVDEKEIRHCLDVFSRKWPGRRFEMICFEYAEDVALSQAKVERGDDYEIISFDLRAKGEGAEPWMSDKAALKCVLERYEVRDYRTSAERRAFAKKELMREMKRFGTTSRIVYGFRKIEWKLMKHLKKDLERHGVSLDKE